MIVNILCNDSGVDVSSNVVVVSVLVWKSRMNIRFWNYNSVVFSEVVGVSIERVN